MDKESTLKRGKMGKEEWKRDESSSTTALPCFCISDHPGENGHKCRPGHTAAGPVPPPGLYPAPQSTSGSSTGSSAFREIAGSPRLGSVAGHRQLQRFAPLFTWHLIMFTGCMKVGQRFVLYSVPLLEHISTSLLTAEPHCGGSWRKGEEGEMTVSSQLSLAVTVPLITGFQTECGEAGHLPS